jgi:hypothetical protein
MVELFVSYRTDDNVHATMAIADRLAAHFGRAHVFRDRDSLMLGMVYPSRIRRALERSDKVLAVIGPQWLDARDARGRSRIDNDRDWVRTELRMAFERGIPVIPILVDGTPLPTQVQLPVDVGLVALSQCHEVRHQSMDADVRALIEDLDPNGAAVLPPSTQTNTHNGNGDMFVNQGGNQTNNLSGRKRR